MLNFIGKLLAFFILPAFLLVGCASNVKATPTSQIDQTIQAEVATMVQETEALKPSPSALPSPSMTPAASSTSSASNIPPATSTPSASSTPTLTATSAAPIAHVNENTNCRIGPGPQYANVYIALAGTDLTVVSATTLNNYVVVDIPTKPGQTCWLLTQYVTISGSLAGLPVITPPPTPTPTPTPTLTPTLTPTVTSTITPTMTPSPTP